METKNKILTVILVIILIGLFGIIFYFSNQNATKSKGLSRKVTETFLGQVTGMDKMNENDKEETLSDADSIVRKIAHFSLYMLVGADAMAIMVVGIGKHVNNKIKAGCAFGIGVVYAISDEIHQLFTSGRAGLISDVLIDSMRCINWNINCDDFC